MEFCGFGKSFQLYISTLDVLLGMRNRNVQLVAMIGFSYPNLVFYLGTQFPLLTTQITDEHETTNS
jgi:hypothetical protein